TIPSSQRVTISTHASFGMVIYSTSRDVSTDPLFVRQRNSPKRQRPMHSATTAVFYCVRWVDDHRIGPRAAVRCDGDRRLVFGFCGISCLDLCVFVLNGMMES